MKGTLFSVAGLGVGAAFFGTMDSPDFDRTIDRSPTAVYAAFSSVAEAGTIGGPDGDDLPAVTLRVVKQEGSAISYELLFDDRPAVTAQLNFEAANGEGTATRMTAEIDVNAYAVGSAFETEAGMALSLVPDSYFDSRFADLMNELADEVQAGRPLQPLGADRMGIRRSDSVDVADRRSETRRAQRDAVPPMTDAAPMVDPNAVARAYREGRPNPDSYTD